jgi:hypothetical protein
MCPFATAYSCLAIFAVAVLSTGVHRLSPLSFLPTAAQRTESAEEAELGGFAAFVCFHRGRGLRQNDGGYTYPGGKGGRRRGARS